MQRLILFIDDVWRPMPELPDVETFNRLVLDHFAERRISRATASDPGILEGIGAESLERRVKGEKLLSSRRYGKHLFLILSGIGTLAMHFGANGSLRRTEGTNVDPSYTRFLLLFVGGDGLAYINPRRIGRIALCESAESFIARTGLGPDALDPAFDTGSFTAILQSSRRDIKSVLMDQTLVAGIGNIYSDEILFQARLHPATPANQIRGKAAAGLFRIMRKTLETAVRCGAGSERGVENLPKSFLLPQRHRGGNCPRCKTLLTSAKRAGRTSYFCPTCQRA